MPLSDQLPCAWKLHMFCLICYLFGIFFVMASFLVSIFSFGIFFCACWHLFPAFQNFFGIFSFRHFFEHLWWHLMSEAQIKRQIHSSSFKRSFFVMQLSQDNRLFRQYGEGNRPQNYLGPVEEGKVTSQKSCDISKKCYGSQKNNWISKYLTRSKKILWDLKKSCEISKTHWDLILTLAAISKTLLS